ncbi:protein AATF [Phymastichus coffea]|uniref:protein AATF n=1 Tax=Phymastichus coffea TaxID=108790 RepID=UPI00273AEE41|nr:protein AATF [Phymastichus coffea]
MSSKKKPLSIAEKISDLITSVPKSFESDDEAEETKAKVVDFNDEIDDDDFDSGFNKCSIRKRNVNLLEEFDRRYKGKKVSKKDIFNEGFSSDGSVESDQGSDEADDGSSKELNKQTFNAASDEENAASDDKGQSDEENGIRSQESNDDSEDFSDEEDEFGDSIDLSNPLRRARETDDTIKTVSATNVRAEIEKGNCIREELKMWENLLEMRIKLQKCLANSNRMPQFDSYKDYDCNDQFKTNCNSVKKELGKLLGNLLDLQSKLLMRYPETEGILSKGQKRKANADGDNDSDEEDDLMDEEIPSDTEDEMNEEDVGKEEEGSEEEETNKKGKSKQARKKFKLSEFEQVISKNHKAYSEYRNAVIQKWNDKTRIGSGVIKKGLVNQPVIKQIEFALANTDKLMKKTQLKRSEYDVVGKTSTSLEESDGRRTQEYDTEIYDDDDFYHQLLRELIEYKSADTIDPIALSKQWVQLQNMRSKMKRKIDTRATKGRRIRYNVHQKLVNFMAPITVNDTWTDRAKDELYSSLFGKIKPVSQEAKPT